MKDNLINSREQYLISRNSNLGAENTSFNSGEICTTSANNYTFKKNCNSIEKYVKTKKDLLIKNDDYVNKLKNNKSFCQANNPSTPKLTETSTVSPIRNFKKTLNPSEGILQNYSKLVNSVGTNKIMYNNLLAKPDKITNKISLKNTSTSFNQKNSSAENNHSTKLYNQRLSNYDVTGSTKPTSNERMSSHKVGSDSSEKSTHSSEYYYNKIKEFKSLFTEIKSNPFIQDKKYLLKDIKGVFQEFKNERTVSNNPSKDENKQLKYSMQNIEKKFDSIMKENESLKEMLKSKTEDFEQMKGLLMNLTNMFEKFASSNKNVTDNNITTSKNISKSPGHTFLRREIDTQKKRSTNSSQSDQRLTDKERKSNKLNDNNSSISICSEFSIENSRDLFNNPTNSNNSLKTNRIRQVLLN